MVRSGLGFDSVRGLLGPLATRILVARAAGANLSVLGDIDEVAARAAPDPKAEEVFAVYALVKGGADASCPVCCPVASF
jgi:hypothetical protein